MADFPCRLKKLDDGIAALEQDIADVRASLAEMEALARRIADAEAKLKTFTEGPGLDMVLDRKPLPLPDPEEGRQRELVKSREDEAVFAILDRIVGQPKKRLPDFIRNSLVPIQPSPVPGTLWDVDGETVCIGEVTDKHVWIEHENQSPTRITLKRFHEMVRVGWLMPVPTLLERCETYESLPKDFPEEPRRLLFSTIVGEFIRDDDAKVRILADACECARSTVRRWASGIAKPMKGVQSYTVKHIKQLTLAEATRAEEEAPVVEEKATVAEEKATVAEEKETVAEEKETARPEEGAAVLPDGSLSLDLGDRAENSRSGRNFGAQGTFSDADRPAGVPFWPQGDPDPA